MWTSKKFVGVLCALVLIWAWAPAYGEGETDNFEGWEFVFTPYLWLTSIDADSTMNNITSSVDLSFSDIVDNFDVFGLAGRFEVWNGCLGFVFDGFYVTASGDFQTTRPVVDVQLNLDLDLTILQGYFSYRTPRIPLGSVGRWPAIWFEPYVGLRFNDLAQEIDVRVAGLGPLGLRRGRDLGGSNFFMDPVFGVRIPFQIMEKLTIAVRGDVGGFGAGSELSAMCFAGIDYRPWRLASFQAGYQGYYLDYESEIRTGDFGLSGWIHGPWLGASFYF
jgi:hypothetical protein